MILKVSLLVSITVAFLAVDDVAGALYGCTNALNTDYYRQIAFELHQQYREKIHSGDAPNKCGGLPKPKDFYKIEYNCDLEDSAAVWANNCQYSYSPGNVRKGAGELLAYTYSTTNTAEQSLVLGFQQRVLTPITTTGINESLIAASQIGDWNQVAQAGARLMGCASKRCDASWTLTVCHYKEAGPLSGKIYTAGDGCASSSDCTIVLNSECVGGYCTAPAPASETANTMCPSNAAMNDAARNLATDWHNYYRALVIQGHEPAAGNKTAPSGKNMYKVAYSCAIEANAQAWADTCPFPNHSTSAQRPGWGENMAYMSDKGSAGAAVQLSIQLFYSELAEFGLTNIDTNVFTSADMSSGHYTQVVWGNTYEIGCGVKLCGSNQHIVCQYNVAGNYLNQIIYELGSPCETDADCTKQAADTCSTSDGLCVRA